MGKKSIGIEFARRAKMFHPNEEPFNIRLWGLFNWCTVSKFVKSGEIILNKGFSKSNRVIWCKPSQEFYDKWVKPFMSYSVEELNNYCEGR